jgi:peroxiredoxin
MIGGDRQPEGAAMTVHSRTAAVGQPAPDFTLTDQHGAPFHLSEAVPGGPVVVVFLRGFG